MSQGTQNAFDACPTIEVLFTSGDRLPEFIGVLKDVDLTGYTIKLNVERPTGLLTKTAIILDATKGKFKFSWSAGDLVEGIGQFCLMRITDTSGLTETLAQFSLDICPDPEAP